mgnify:CR=1 FL=1
MSGSTPTVQSASSATSTPGTTFTPSSHHQQNMTTSTPLTSQPTRTAIRAQAPNLRITVPASSIQLDSDLSPIVVNSTSAAAEQKPPNMSVVRPQQQVQAAGGKTMQKVTTSSATKVARVTPMGRSSVAAAGDSVSQQQSASRVDVKPKLAVRAAAVTSVQQVFTNYRIVIPRVLVDTKSHNAIIWNSQAWSVNYCIYGNSNQNCIVVYYC